MSNDVRSRFAHSTLDSTLYLIPLISLQIGLEVLVHAQYGQKIEANAFLTRLIPSVIGRANPILLQLQQKLKCILLVYAICISVIHPRRQQPVIQWLLCLSAILIGYYLVDITQNQSYFAMMRQAPPLGTILIWLYIEMDMAECMLSAILLFVTYYSMAL